jgi:hypothetical protein
LQDRRILCAKLAEASRRARLLRALSGSIRVTFLAHLVLVPWLLLKALCPLPLGHYLLVVFAAFAAGGTWGLLAPMPTALVARLLDQRLALKERLLSALEAMNRGGHPMVDALMHDAAQAAARVHPPDALPLSFPAEGRLLLAAVALAAALILLPPAFPRMPGAAGPGGKQGTDGGRPTSAAEAGRPDQARRDPVRGQGDPEARSSNAVSMGLGRRSGGGATVTYQDSAIAPARPDFAEFLKSGDERLKLLGPSAAFPDLRRDYTQSQAQARIRRMRDAVREARRGQPSPETLQRLVEQVRGLDRGSEARGPQNGRRSNVHGRPGGLGSGGEGREGGFTEREADTVDKRLEALDRALALLLQKDGARAGGRDLMPAPEQSEAESDRSGTSEGPGYDSAVGGREKGSRPGRSVSPLTRDRPTPRIDARPSDHVLTGQAREGEQESYDADRLGRGARGPSRVPYLELLTQYRRMAEEALGKERVPFNYREQVKEYFDSLERRP